VPYINDDRVRDELGIHGADPAVLPSAAHVGLTAGTGGLTDAHTVRAVTITRP